MRHLPFFPFLVLLCTTIGFGCSGQSSGWAESEIENASHYFLSADHDIESSRIINSGKPFQEIPEAELQRIMGLKRNALIEARTVTDNVLEKALPGLSQPFRDYYQRSLELFLESAEQGFDSKIFESERLRDQWVDWAQRNGPRIRVPKGVERYLN